MTKKNKPIMAKEEYRVNPGKVAKTDGFIPILMDKEYINFGGDAKTIDIPGSQSSSPIKRTYRKGTQGDFKRYYEMSLANGLPTQTLVTKHDAAGNAPDITSDK